MTEAIMGKLHRNVEAYVQEHGTGSLALVNYVSGAFDLVCVEDDGLGDYTLLPMAGPPINDDVIDWLVDIDALMVGFMETGQ